MEIYFLSNENEYRSPSVQLDLKIPSIRQEYLKYRPEDTRYLDYRSKNRNLTWAFDTSQQADEVVIPGRIPANRVIGRCTLTDLQTKCDMNWLFDGLRSDQKYQQILSQLPTDDISFLEKMAVSAKKLRSLCEIQDQDIASLTDKILFDALIDGLNKGRNVSLWTIAKEVWDASLSKSIVKESEGAYKPGSESVEDLDGIFSSMSLGSNRKSQEGTFYQSSSMLTILSRHCSGVTKAPVV